MRRGKRNGRRVACQRVRRPLSAPERRAMRTHSHNRPTADDAAYAQEEGATAQLVLGAVALLVIMSAMVLPVFASSRYLQSLLR